MADGINYQNLSTQLRQEIFPYIRKMYEIEALDNNEDIKNLIQNMTIVQMIYMLYQYISETFLKVGSGGYRLMKIFSIDIENNPLRVWTVRMLTSSFFDKYQRQQSANNFSDLWAVFDNAKASNYDEYEYISDLFYQVINQNPRNVSMDRSDNDVNQAQFAMNLNYYKMFRQSQQSMQNYIQFNRNEIFDVDVFKRKTQDDDNLQMAFSIQSVINYMNLSDSDFIKSIIIIQILVVTFSSVPQFFNKVSEDENNTYFYLMITKMLVELSKMMRSNNDPNFFVFQQRIEEQNEANVDANELIRIMMNLQNVSPQNIVIMKQQRFEFRPAYSELIINNSLDGIIRQGQMLNNVDYDRIVRLIKQIKRAPNDPQQYSEINTRIFTGNIFEIMKHLVYSKIIQYLSDVQYSQQLHKDYKFMSIAISCVIQTPKARQQDLSQVIIKYPKFFYDEDIAMRDEDLEQNEGRENSWNAKMREAESQIRSKFEMYRNPLIMNGVEINDEGNVIRVNNDVYQNDALSEFFTLQLVLQIEIPYILNKNQLESMNYLGSQLKRQVVAQIQQLLSQYVASIEGFRQLSLIFGLDNAIVRNARIRPYIIPLLINKVQDYRTQKTIDLQDIANKMTDYQQEFQQSDVNFFQAFIPQKYEKKPKEQESLITSQRLRQRSNVTQNILERAQQLKEQRESFVSQEPRKMKNIRQYVEEQEQQQLAQQQQQQQQRQQQRLRRGIRRAEQSVDEILSQMSQQQPQVEEEEEEIPTTKEEQKKKKRFKRNDDFRALTDEDRIMELFCNFKQEIPDMKCDEYVLMKMLQITPINEILPINDTLGKILYIQNKFPEKYIYIDYSNQTIIQQLLELKNKLSKLDCPQLIIIFKGKNHIFIQESDQLDPKLLQNVYKVQIALSKKFPKSGQIQKLLWQVENKFDVDGSYQFKKRNNLMDQLVSHLKISKKQQTWNEMLFHLHRCQIEFYYDFETTFDDLNGLPQKINQKAIEERLQIDFMCGLIMDIKLPFKRIFEGLMKDIYDITGYFIRDPLFNLDMLDFEECIQKVFEGIPSAKLLIEFLNYKSDEIHAMINEFDKKVELARLFTIERVHKDKLKKIQKLFNYCKISTIKRGYAYFGRGFDAQLILNTIKDIEGDQWPSKVSYTGDLNSMKILNYNGYQFLDMQLITAGGSLAKLCEDFHLDDKFKKGKMDFQKKMATLSLVLQPENYAEIKKYVLQDCVAIQQIHLLVRKQLSNLIIEYAKQHQEFDLTPLQIVNFYDIFGLQAKPEDYLTDIVFGQCHYFATISSLCTTLFQSFFNDCTITGPKKQKEFLKMRSSYTGGRTQAFCMGKIPEQLGDVFYLDINSMYPWIMSIIQFPVDLHYYYMVNEKQRVVLQSNNYEIYFNSYYITNNKVKKLEKIFDCGQSNKIKFDKNQLHYDLFTVTKFEFIDSCFAPLFAVKTKSRGTIFPLKFDYDTEKQLLLDEVTIFGFQIITAFQLGILKSIEFSSVCKYGQQGRVFPLFAQFDIFMYAMRLLMKTKNKSLAQLIKILINSLYGKFGQRPFDIEFPIRWSDYKDDTKFRSILIQQLQKHQTADLDYLEATNYKDLKISHHPLRDFKQRNEDMVVVKISNIPHKMNHIGSLVVLASLITKTASTYIAYLMNEISLNSSGKTFYCDTDSLITDKNAFDYLKKKNNKVTIHETQLGAFKNEYPLNGDQNQTNISDVTIINKKIYKFNKKSDKHTTIKFKGCQNPQIEAVDTFLSQKNYITEQERFIKGGGINICKLKFIYGNILSNKFAPTQPYDDFIFTQPFNSITEQEETYSNEQRAFFSNGRAVLE